MLNIAWDSQRPRARSDKGCRPTHQDGKHVSKKTKGNIGPCMGWFVRLLSRCPIMHCYCFLNYRNKNLGMGSIAM